MCGRIVLSSAPHVLAETFYLDVVPDLGPRWNIAPGTDIAAVRPNPDSPGNLVRMLRWGLVPPWERGDDGLPQLVNARAETVLAKPAFREAFRRRRCLVPVDGFYEWRKGGGRSQPFYFRARDGRPFALAGLWEPREQPGDRRFETGAIITTEANALMRPVHHRMPVILPPTAWKIWLGAPAAEAENLLSLLRPAPAGLLLSHPVTARIGNAAFEGPECVAPVEDETTGQLNLFG
ncbi:SOS response-associated peptidase [bacterium]|nr:SOS response-associated peptidase [bacterium]